VAAGDEGDEKSIQRLNDATIRCFNHEKVRLAYIAAQTANVDLKIDMAIMEVMRVYRGVLGTASGLAMIPGASTTNRTAAAYSICKEILKCFGLPTLDTKTVLKIVKVNVWDDLGHNVSVALAEGIAFLGIAATVALWGLPVCLASNVNIPIVVPATTRLMLMLAGDLILILTRAFKRTTYTCIGMPEDKDIAQAAREYSAVSPHVHKELLEVVPRRNLLASYDQGKVRERLGTVIARYKYEVSGDIDAAASSNIKVRRNSERRVATEEVEQDLEELETEILPAYQQAEQEAKESGAYLAVAQVEAEKRPLLCG